MGVTIKGNGIKNIKGKIKVIENRTNNPEKCFEYIGSYLSAYNRKMFATNGAFGGKVWAPLKPDYQQWKIRHSVGKATLVRSGKLKASYTSRPMKIERYGKTVAVYGTDVKYAHFHESGTRKMPARVVMQANSKVRKDIQQIVADYISGRPVGIRSML